MIYCQWQMLIIDYSLYKFRASLCPSSGEKTTCYCIWSVFAVTIEDADISRVVFYGDSVWFDKLGLLVCVCVCVCVAVLHLVGILSSRFAHDARSQEHKAFLVGFDVLTSWHIVAYIVTTGVVEYL